MENGSNGETSQSLPGIHDPAWALTHSESYSGFISRTRLSEAGEAECFTTSGRECFYCGVEAECWLNMRHKPSGQEGGGGRCGLCLD